jgi:hypothetical protein
MDKFIDDVVGGQWDGKLRKLVRLAGQLQACSIETLCRYLKTTIEICCILIIYGFDLEKI